jgi:phosphohistidine phosphatase
MNGKHGAPRRRLLLIRHAKSDWAEPELADHSRPLADRGRREAPQLGKALVRAGWLPDVACSSTARRAIETWQLIAKELPSAVPLERAPGLYLAGPRDLCLTLQETLDTDSFAEAGCVAVIGHNPGLSAWASKLANRQVDMQTSTAIGFELADLPDWRKLSPQTSGVMRLWIYPPDFACE